MMFSDRLHMNIKKTLTDVEGDSSRKSCKLSVQPPSPYLDHAAFTKLRIRVKSMSPQSFLKFWLRSTHYEQLFPMLYTQLFKLSEMNSVVEIS